MNSLKNIALLSLLFINVHLFAQKQKTTASKNQAAGQPLTSAALGKMEARHIGPAVMGGRITAIDGYNACLLYTSRCV